MAAFGAYALFTVLVGVFLAYWDVRTDGYVLEKYEAEDGRNRWRVGKVVQRRKSQPDDYVQWLQPGATR